MTEYEREKVRDLVMAMTDEEKEIAWEVLIQERNKDDKKDDDLISRKAAYKAFSDYLNRNFIGEISSQTELSIGEIASVIKSIPTAFDKEKVIEDLTDWKNDAERWAAKYDEVGDTDNMDLQDMAVRCYVNAIEIVKKGGIE